MTPRRAAAYAIVVIGFGAPIAGALTPSYLHLADWWQSMMPVEWQALSYVAALTTEAVIVSCGILRAVARGRLTPEDDTLTRRLEWSAVAAAIYVNARWAALRPDAAPITLSVPGAFATVDIVVAAAGLPVAARFGFVALGIGWRLAGKVDAAPAATGKAVGTPRRQPIAIEAPPPPATMPPIGGKMATDALVASRAGVAARTARQWRTAGDARYGQWLESSAS